MRQYAVDIHERVFAFACSIVKLHQILSRRRGTDATLSHQLLRAGTSIGANLEESRAGQSRPDFISKCRIALKEARETYYWLRLLEQTTTTQVPITPIREESGEIVAILTSIVKRSTATKSLDHANEGV